MSTSIALAGAKVLAAVTPPRSRSAFNRAQLVIRSVEGTLMRAQTYTDAGRIEGPLLSEPDLQGLLDAGHAIELPKSMSATEGAQLWVLRSNFPGRDRALQELNQRGVLAHAPSTGPDDARLCIVNAGKEEAARLLDTWRDEAVERASASASRGDWAGTTAEAEFAQALSRGLDARGLALLSLAYERCDRTRRAAGIRTMARRSRGEAFGLEVDAALADWRAALGADASKPAPQRPESPAAKPSYLQRFPNPVGFILTSRRSWQRPAQQLAS